MVEFGQLVTDTFRRAKPHLSVAHQSLAFHAGWSAGGSVELADVTDWLSADLYGERYGLSFFAKQFYSLSTTKPFEHINTWSWPNIHEHVITRTEDHLRLTALSALMNHGAMVLIDAIDPVGTVHTQNYELGGRVYADLARYEGEVGGRFCQDVGIYYSFDSNVDLTENGQDVAAAGYTFDDCWKQPTTPTAHRNAAISLARTLIQAHLPFGVVTRRDLEQLVRLAGHRAAQRGLPGRRRGGGAARLRGWRRQPPGQQAHLADHARWRAAGGLRAGRRLRRLLRGRDGRDRHLRGPVRRRRRGLPGLLARRSRSRCTTRSCCVTAHPGTEVLATVTLPWTHPTEARYAAILTDPPGVATASPAVVRHRYGKGQVIYCAGVIESWQHDTQQAVLVSLLRSLASRPLWVEMEARPSRSRPRSSSRRTVTASC